MTLPLMALAVGAIVAGLVGVPVALGGGNTIERFLEPSFTAEQVPPHPQAGVRPSDVTAGAELERGRTSAGEVKALEHAPGAVEQSGEHVSRGVELGLMAFSLVIAIIGIALAYKFYVTSPEIADQLAQRFAGAHRTLLNKYYVDELYDATVISGTTASARRLWTFDRKVVDGAVNGTSWFTVISSWLSGLTDRTVVDGLVNLVGWIVQESSLVFRRFQTGLVQNYALLMLFGIFVFVGIYLFVR
jgi:NADH-quinone oxidoreductase subunit L